MITAVPDWVPELEYWLAWPTRKVVWDPWIGRAAEEYTELARAVSTDARVHVLCTPEQLTTVTQILIEAGATAEVIALQIDDGWIRDSGPLPVLRDGRRELVDFGFNSWGNRFKPDSADQRVGGEIAKRLGLNIAYCDFVLEGGAISVDGNGNAIVVEECVLNPNRNGPRTKDDFAALALANLGVSKITWLPFGLLEDLKNTDGHVDNVAVFIEPGTIFAQLVDDSNVNRSRLNENLRILHSARDSTGEAFTVRTIQHLPYATMPDGSAQPSPYINLLQTAHQVLFPSVDTTMDEAAEPTLRNIFPSKTVRFVSSTAIAFGGGGPHCIAIGLWPRADPMSKVH